jgi:hypothetical protein
MNEKQSTLASAVAQAQGNGGADCDTCPTCGQSMPDSSKD